MSACRGRRCVTCCRRRSRWRWPRRPTGPVNCSRRSGPASASGPSEPPARLHRRAGLRPAGAGRPRAAGRAGALRAGPGAGLAGRDGRHASPTPPVTAPPRSPAPATYASVGMDAERHRELNDGVRRLIGLPEELDWLRPAAGPAVALAGGASSAPRRPSTRSGIRWWAPGSTSWTRGCMLDPETGAFTARIRPAAAGERPPTGSRRSHRPVRRRRRPGTHRPAPARRLSAPAATNTPCLSTVAGRSFAVHLGLFRHANVSFV